MLIEAQTQKLLAEQLKAKNDGEEKKEPLAMDVDDTEKKDPLKEELTDVEMTDVNEKPPEEPADKEETDDKSIDIDPKTFCKLGHFHLLLEDYAKGEHRQLNSYWKHLIETLHHFRSIVGLSKVSRPSPRSLERHCVSVRVGSRLSAL